jgi:hypothetical protein
MVNKSMTSNWALPTIITQYAEEGAEDAHVSWLEDNNFSSLKNLDGRSIKTSRDLLHIARDPRHNIKEKTYFLKVTGFNFIDVPNIISGIEVKVTSNRYGRITDETIQLTLNNTIIGDNQASLDLNPIKIYGGQDNLWNTNLTTAGMLNTTFGVVLRFQSHPRWPHKSGMMLDSVEVRVY